MVTFTHCRRVGFTLIELLVVVAIIVVLIAILLPSLAKARDQAKSTQCLSGLKSMGNASASYSAECDGYLFPDYWASWNETATNQGSGPQIDIRGVFANYLQMADWSSTNRRTNVWTCPCIVVDINAPAQQWPLTYGANCMPHPRLNADPTVAPVVQLKATQLTRPGEIISICDTAQLTTGTSQGFIDGTNVSPPYGWWSSTSEASLPAYPPGCTTLLQANVDFQTSRVRYRHSGNRKVNALFEDGHAESVTGPIYGRNLSTRY